ncbi:MAG: ABC transporter permease, partial [Bryobacterales bacterium]|nr:ABC transporter permease [Bryobacterales bacterium]
LYALRTFRQNPGFTAVVILSIALGIAANTTVFSIVNGLLLGDLPVSEPERLLAFSGGRSMSYPDYIDYRDQTRDVFEGVSAHFPVVPASLGGTGEPERVWGQLVSGNYFPVIGVRPALGRGVTPAEDDAPGRDAVVVLSHALWQRRFGADPGVIGRAVPLNGQPYTIIGVTPPGFRGTDRGIVAEFFAPLAMYAQLMPDLAQGNPTQQRGNNWLTVNARLKRGVSRQQALAAVAVIKNRIDDTYFKGDEDRRQRLVTLAKSGRLMDKSGRSVIGLMAVLMSVVAGVLMIACANVANLMLARATARQKEIAIRLSVGANRGRLVRQLLTESVLLALLGAAAGFALAFWTARLISRFQLPFPLPIVFDFTPDLRVLAFTAALSLFTGILFGLAPALRATRPDLVAALKNETTVFGRTRRFGVRDALVVVQVALSLVLLAGSGLFLRSLQSACSIDIGMRPDNVLLMAVDPKLHRYSREKTQQFVSQLRERVSALPEVRSVTFLDSVPLSFGGTSNDFTTESGNDGVKRTNADVYGVGMKFFETMQLPLRRGREFDLQTDAADVAIINENMAKKLFGDQDPIGRQLSSVGTKYTVVGVAGNTKSRTLGEEPAAVAYLFVELKPEEVMSFYGISIAVKTSGSPRKLERGVRKQIATLDPTLAIFNTETMQEHINKALLVPRLCATLLGVFGGVGLTLAGIGLYGVMSYSARRRTREFGIRMALGAGQGGVLRMVLRQGLVLTAIGIAIGLAVALSVTRFAASQLYGISATDRVTFLVVPAVLLAVALVAILVPALRASRIAPMNALRFE